MRGEGWFCFAVLLFFFSFCFFLFFYFFKNSYPLKKNVQEAEFLSQLYSLVFPGSWNSYENLCWPRKHRNAEQLNSCIITMKHVQWMHYQKPSFITWNKLWWSISWIKRTHLIYVLLLNHFTSYLSFVLCLLFFSQLPHFHACCLDREWNQEQEMQENNGLFYVMSLQISLLC